MLSFFERPPFHRDMLHLPRYQLRKLDHHVGATDQRKEKDVSNRMRCAGDLL